MNPLKTTFYKLKKQDKKITILKSRMEAFWRKYSQATLTERMNITAQEIQTDFLEVQINSEQI